MTATAGESPADHRYVEEAISRSAEHVLAEAEERFKALPASHNEVSSMRVALDELAKDLRVHIAREEETLVAAFPGGDLAAHRLTHEQMMEALREETKFWRELRADLLKNGITGLIVIVLGLVMVGVTFKLGLAK